MFDLTKRINRITYWVGYLLVVAGFVLIAVIISAVSVYDQEEISLIYELPIFFAFLGLLWLMVVLAKQRCNDISGDSAFLWFFLSIFLIGPIVGLLPGEKKRNKYGTIPSGVTLFAKTDDKS